jgi:hypothetical protein
MRRRRLLTWVLVLVIALVAVVFSRCDAEPPAPSEAHLATPATRPGEPLTASARAEAPPPTASAPSEVADAGRCDRAALDRLLRPLDADLLQQALTPGSDGGVDPVATLMGRLDRDALRAWSECRGDGDGGVTDVLSAIWERLVRSRLEFNATQAERWVERFCQQSAQVLKQPAFADAPRTRDAAVFLSGRIDWKSGHLPLPTGSLKLPTALQDRIRRPGGIRAIQPADYAGLDFGWMHEFLEYDHWSLYGAGPLRDLDESAWNYTTWQLPNYQTLMDWARARLAKGVHEQQFEQAAAEVRHLAQLCGSNETIIGLRVRSRLYQLEREARALTPLTPPPGLPTDEEITVQRATIEAGRQLLLPGVPPAVRQRALACAPSPCVALTEATAITASLREVVPGAAAHLAWLEAQPGCESAFRARVAKTAPYSPRGLEDVSLGLQTFEVLLTPRPSTGL